MKENPNLPPQENQLVFLPLGGSNEIGMNLNAYGFGPANARKWIVVDCGVTFASEEHISGVDIILPDPAFLESVKDDILGIVLTHAHEDHIGAIGHLWPRLGAPLYATAFTAELIKDKLKEHALDAKVQLNIVPLKAAFELGPFAIEYITITHSIAEPNGLKITTPLGVVFHTGDWKIDPNPLIGEVTDVAAITRMGEAGVLAMVCDSTNVFVKGESGSEAGVREELIKQVAGIRGKIAIACFASNVARVSSAVEAATLAGRKVCLLGRSMVRVAGAARKIGLFEGVDFVEPEKASRYSDDEMLYLCTGSQGEPRAALARIASGSHPHLSLGLRDTVLFSSREIPGNEREIYDLINRLIMRGAKVITSHDAPIHVSGHPCRDELVQMYGWVRPKIAIPTHGERRHLIEHAKLAQELQIEHGIVPRNGDMVLIAPNGPAIIDEVPNGRLYVDGNAILSQDAETISERHRIAENGFIIVSLSIDVKGKIVAGPDVRSRGIAEKNGKALDKSLETLADLAQEAVMNLKAKQRLDEEYCEDKIMRSVRKAAFNMFKKKPMVEVFVMTV
ncbi:MAG: beta-lactamase domain-containing protein [Hyphomonadaceae bacterium]|nr:MAG: beta-lactamase domain-containing protein [Hyphomonadaceae bacterium]